MMIVIFPWQLIQLKEAAVKFSYGFLMMDELKLNETKELRSVAACMHDSMYVFGSQNNF
jgi:hypothetical protein